ncbi:hypothetical protein QCA50_013266 [Cerrena zonata]|uniref:Uncharacterized protein n=1 Tax=Cerrena zonata TaxID=2478898 RepID=A0AAW0FX16_9APHY
MIHNGSIQFGILLLLNIFAMILDVLAVASTNDGATNASEFIYIQWILTSIILSHFILDLRSIYHTTKNPSQTSSKLSSLHFASAIEGNMGATLATSLGSNREDQEEETEKIQYSDYPFSTGLADIKEINPVENVEETPEAGPSGITHDSEPSIPHTSVSTYAGEGIEEIELQEIV